MTAAELEEVTDALLARNATIINVLARTSCCIEPCQPQSAENERLGWLIKLIVLSMSLPCAVSR